LQFHRGLDILEKINHADGFSSTFLTQGDSGAKQKALSRTALLWFFWQFVEFGHWLIIVSRCRDWIVQMFKILHVWVRMRRGSWRLAVNIGMCGC